MYFEKVRDIISKQLDIDPATITMTSRLIDDLRRQPVTLGKAIGYQIADFAPPLPGHQPQGAYSDSTGRRAVTIVIGDDQDVCLRFERVGQ